jgi:predicted MFS family arabinose efflux permease
VTAADLVQAPDIDRLARRNALVLAVTQAFAGANNTVIVTTGGIVGAMLAPDRSLATVPITMMVLGMWLGTLPLGALAHTLGRRNALQIATVFGMLAGLISCAAVLQGSFVLLLLGAFSGGLYAAGHQSYRFAATDTASETFRPKAVSWVLAGGVFAALLGPQLIIFTKDLWPPYLFAATFIGQSAFAVLSGLTLLLVRIPRPVAAKNAGSGRPLSMLARQPAFVVAALSGIASYSMMNMVMTSAPLAMVDCGISVTTATLGLQWHVLAMFAPSFFTGALIVRYGVERVTLVGFALIIVSALIGMAGITVAHFWIGLILLGLGWNFSFIGATTMVTRCHRPEEGKKVQAFNDFLVFGSMAVGSAASGVMLDSFGWFMVNGMVLPIVLTAVALIAWLMLRRRAQAA